MPEHDAVVVEHSLPEPVADVPPLDAPTIICTPPAPPANFREFLVSLTGEEAVHWGRVATSTEAAHAIATHYDLDYADVRDTMNTMSETLWCLLDSTEGWTVLGEQIALAIQGRVDVPVLQTKVH